MRVLLASSFLVTLVSRASGQTASTGRVMIDYDELASAHVAPAARRIAYGSASQQIGELRLPADARARHGVIVLVHGGCWQSAYDAAYTRPAAAALAAAGYVVWTPEYRRLGDPGGGWPGTFDDVGAAIDHLRQIARDVQAIDTSRIVLVGHSAGGQLALWAASRRSPRSVDGRVTGVSPLRPAGVVSLAGINSLAAYGAQPGGCNSAVEELMGGSPAVHPDRYRAADPIDHLPLGVPVALVQGNADPIVPPAQSTTYAARARAAGDSVALSIVPRVGHFDVLAPQSTAWPAVLAAIRAIMKP